MMKTRQLLLVALVCLVLPGKGFAQTAEIMDQVISSSGLSVSLASYLVFVSSGKLPEDATTEQAFTLLQEMNWLEARGNPDRTLRFEEYAFLLTKTFGLPGGLLGSLFPVPRYAYRDLVFRGFLSGKGDPDDPVTGVEAVRILGKVLDNLVVGGRS